jgi:hypothetical protein
MSDGAAAERIYASWSYGSQSRQFAIASSELVSKEFRHRVAQWRTGSGFTTVIALKIAGKVR